MVMYGTRNPGMLGYGQAKSQMCGMYMVLTGEYDGTPLMDLK